MFEVSPSLVTREDHVHKVSPSLSPLSAKHWSIKNQHARNKQHQKL